MAAGGTERTSGYFGDQTPSGLKKPCFPFRVWFYHFSSTPLLQTLLDQSDQSARFYFTLKKNPKLLTLYNNKPPHQETNTIKNGTNRIKQEH
jgi:hypothetical protein